MVPLQGRHSYIPGNRLSKITQPGYLCGLAADLPRFWDCQVQLPRYLRSRSGTFDCRVTGCRRWGCWSL